MIASDILRQVALEHGVDMEVMRAPYGLAHVSAAKRHVFYRLRAELGWSYPHIARFMGLRDHTTVMYGVKKHLMSAPANMSPPPEGFQDFVLSNGRHKAMKHFGIGRTTFRRMCVDAGIWGIVEARSPNATRTIAMPDGFAAIATLRNRDIQDIHPHLSDRVIAKFRKSLGLKGQCEGKPFVKGKSGGAWSTPKKAPTIDYRDTGRTGDAQRFLQKHMAVVKASIMRKDADGYMVAGRIMPTADMVALAQRKGWVPYLQI